MLALRNLGKNDVAFSWNLADFRAVSGAVIPASAADIRVQEYYKAEEGKDPMEEARKLLKGIEESGKITVVGNPAFVTGRSVIARKVNSRIQGLFTILSDEHSISDAQYTTTLGLRFEEVV